MVHCLLCMVLFDMNLSYGLTTDQCDFRVFMYRSYHDYANSIPPYKAFNSRRYITFTPFSHAHLPYFMGSPLHSISKNSYSLFNMMNFSSGISALRYDPGTPKISTYLTSCMSTIRPVNRTSKYIIDKDTSYLGMYHLCALPFSNIITFIFTHLLYFIRFIARSAPLFCKFVMLSGSSTPINFMYSIYMYSFYMDAIALFPCIFITFLAVFCVNVSSKAI